MATLIDKEAVIASILAQFELDIQSLHITCGDNLFKILVNEAISYETLAPYLGVSRMDVLAIQKDTALNYKGRKLRLLQLWKKKRGNEATYLSLVRAFLDAGDRHCAEFVVSHAKHLSLSRLPDQGSVFPDKTIPSWDDMSEKEKKVLQEKLVVEVDKVKYHYASCLTDIKRSFEKRDAYGTDIKIFLLSKLQFDAMLSHEIDIVHSVVTIFMTFAKCTSWFNYQLLESTVHKFGCEEEKAKLSEYEKTVLKPYLQQSLFQIQVPSKSLSTVAIADAPAVYLCLKFVEDIDISDKNDLILKAKLSKLLEVPALELSSWYGNHIFKESIYTDYDELMKINCQLTQDQQQLQQQLETERTMKKEMALQFEKDAASKISEAALYYDDKLQQLQQQLTAECTMKTKMAQELDTFKTISDRQRIETKEVAVQFTALQLISDDLQEVTVVAEDVFTISGDGPQVSQVFHWEKYSFKMSIP